MQLANYYLYGEFPSSGLPISALKLVSMGSDVFAKFYHKEMKSVERFSVIGWLWIRICLPVSSPIHPKNVLMFWIMRISIAPENYIAIISKVSTQRENTALSFEWNTKIKMTLPYEFSILLDLPKMTHTQLHERNFFIAYDIYLTLAGAQEKLFENNRPVMFFILERRTLKNVPKTFSR